MSSLNLVQLIGSLGRDPELRHTQGGDPVCNLSLATSERWRDKNEEMQERTEWHRVTLWGPVAEIAAKFLQKGGKVYIQGQLETRKWEDQSGQERYTTEIVVRGFKGQMILLDRPPQRDDSYGQSGPATAPASRGAYPSRNSEPRSRPPAKGFDDLDDEIPF